jgi:hypothetical protein
MLAVIVAARPSLNFASLRGENPGVRQSDFCDVQPRREDHSESGWTIVDGFQWYLELQRARFDDREPFG